jgi:hypothetical protein
VSSPPLRESALAAPPLEDDELLLEDELPEDELDELPEDELPESPESSSSSPQPINAAPARPAVPTAAPLMRLRLEMRPRRNQ